MSAQGDYGHFRRMDSPSPFWQPRPGRGGDRKDTSSRSRSPPDRDATEPEPLVDQLIRDLNELDDVPFFDVRLPYELAINIFQYLNRRSCSVLYMCYEGDSHPSCRGKGSLHRDRVSLQA